MLRRFTDWKHSVNFRDLVITATGAYLFVHRIQDIELKKAAKFFAQKFATGSSVTKNPQGLDEIVVQGDVSNEIMEMIEEKEGLLKAVPKDNVVRVEEKKKKGGD